jgi:hypothetical protein
MIMRIKRIVETCTYSSDLKSTKRSYVDVLGLLLIEGETHKLVFLKAGKSMLLVFNPSKTMISNKELPAHGKISPPSSIH